MTVQDVSTRQTESSHSTRQAESPRRLRMSVVVIAVLLGLTAMVPFVTGSVFHFHIAIMICIAAMAAGGLGVIAWVGQLSLAQGAFVGIGAYFSAHLVMGMGLPFLISAPVAGLVAALIAWIIGAPLLRLRGVYFVLITFAMNELFRLLMLEFPGISGGSSGLAGLPGIAIGPWALTTKPQSYVFVLVCLLAVLGLMYLVRRGPLGRNFMAAEESLTLAEATGLPTARTQLQAFAIGSGIAGFTGAVMGHYIGFISPETFGFQLSVSYIIMLVVGGRLHPLGPLLGALILVPLPEFLRGMVHFQHIFYGAILILILMFLPDGVTGLARRFTRPHKEETHG
jgi:branched-chain amino acid transport system permease protein